MVRVTRGNGARQAARAVLVSVGLLGSFAVTAQAQSATPKGFVNVGLGIQAPTKAFSNAWTETVNVETARYEAQYGKKGGRYIDAGFGVRVMRQLYLGVALTQTRHHASADVSASVPHPFFFNRLRDTTGPTSGVRRGETATHVQATWRMPMGPKLDLSLFGGPSWLSVDQGFVDKVTVTEAFPFDTITFQSAQVVQRTGTGIGGHVGADVAFRLGSHFGLGGQVRFVAAKAEIEIATGRTVKVNAGGASATAGLRLFF